MRRSRIRRKPTISSPSQIYRYAGETAGPVEPEQLPGSYKWISHGRDISDELHRSETVRLEKNGTLSGAVTGTWELTGSNELVLEADGHTYRGIFLKQWDENGLKYVMTFTALCSETGTAVWGSGQNALE